MKLCSEYHCHFQPYTMVQLKLCLHLISNIIIFYELKVSFTMYSKELQILEEKKIKFQCN